MDYVFATDLWPAEELFVAEQKRKSSGSLLLYQGAGSQPFQVSIVLRWSWQERDTSSTRAWVWLLPEGTEGTVCHQHTDEQQCWDFLCFGHTHWHFYLSMCSTMTLHILSENYQIKMSFGFLKERLGSEKWSRMILRSKLCKSQFRMQFINCMVSLPFRGHIIYLSTKINAVSPLFQLCFMTNTRRAASDIWLHCSAGCKLNISATV